MRGPYLAERVRDAAVSNANQRQIGDGWLNLRGAADGRRARVDRRRRIAIDEYDLIPPGAIPIAERRLSAPTSLGLIRRIGWPTIDDYGIARPVQPLRPPPLVREVPRCRERQFIRFFRRRASEADEEGDGLPNATSAYVDCAA